MPCLLHHLSQILFIAAPCSSMDSWQEFCQQLWIILATLRLWHSDSTGTGLWLSWMQHRLLLGWLEVLTQLGCDLKFIQDGGPLQLSILQQPGSLMQEAVTRAVSAGGACPGTEHQSNVKQGQARSGTEQPCLGRDRGQVAPMPSNRHDCDATAPWPRVQPATFQGAAVVDAQMLTHESHLVAAGLSDPSALEVVAGASATGWSKQPC